MVTLRPASTRPGPARPVPSCPGVSFLQQSIYFYVLLFLSSLPFLVPTLFPHIHVSSGRDGTNTSSKYAVRALFEIFCMSGKCPRGPHLLHCIFCSPYIFVSILLVTIANKRECFLATRRQGYFLFIFIILQDKQSR